MDQAARGAAALAATNYDDAIKHYSDAIASNPAAVDYYIKRSTAYQRTSKYPEALADAETAVALAHKRAKRELIKDAQLRRGIALFFIGQFANAQHVLGIVRKLDDKEKTLAVWEAKVASKLKGIPEDDERRTVTAEDIPTVEVSTKPQPSKPEPTKGEGKKDTHPKATPSSTPLPSNVKPRHDWYQNNDTVTFMLLVKHVPKDKATVEIQKDSLSITYPVDDDKDFTYDLMPFYAAIDPEKSSYRITPTKIEVTLKKATPGVKWHTLEGENNEDMTTEARQITTPDPSQPLVPRPADAVPAYPTSSKKGPKNWDNLASDELEGDDLEEGDEATRFFRTLYKGAAPDAQRAMMKSYQESGGTVLSTDWHNVGTRFVEPEPPEGMEAKKY